MAAPSYKQPHRAPSIYRPTSPSTKGPTFLDRMGGGILQASGDIAGYFQKKGASEWDEALIEYQGQFSRRMAEINEKRLMKEVDLTVGTAIANAGASGFTIDSESTQQAIDDIVNSGALDAALIRLRGDIGQWEADLRLEQLDSEMEQQFVSSLFNAGGSILSSYSRGK